MAWLSRKAAISTTLRMRDGRTIYDRLARTRVIDIRNQEASFSQR
jgi:hypothetical protein